MLNKRKGFTLIELMIVVAIIGILAAIAIPAFIKYVKQFKVSEAGLNLKTLADGATAYYEADHYTNTGTPVSEKMFPTSDGAFATKTQTKQPASIPKGTKEPVSQTTWNATPWKELKFVVAKPHYFRYRYEPSNASNAGDNFSTRGEADLDADGTSSRFNLNGETNSSGDIKLTPIFVTDLSNELE